MSSTRQAEPNAFLRQSRWSSARPIVWLMLSIRTASLLALLAFIAAAIAGALVLCAANLAPLLAGPSRYADQVKGLPHLDQLLNAPDEEPAPAKHEGSMP